MVVEHAFGLLKNKFRRIHSTLKVSSWKRAVAIIRSCIHLHNFILDNKQSETDSAVQLAGLELPSDGKQKRDTIATMIE